MATLLFRRSLFFFFLIITCGFPVLPSFADDPASSAGAATPEPPQSTEALPDAPSGFTGGYFHIYLTDLNAIATSPARWDSSDWITATVITGIAAGLYDNDAKIQKWALAHKTAAMDDLGDKATLIGHGKFTPVVLGGMYAYGHLTDDGKMSSTVLLSIESFVLTGLAVQTLKYSTHRHRPYTDDPPRTWDGPRLHSSGAYRSFPSGHASSAFAVAAVIAEEYENTVIPPFVYGLAALTALNRVAHNAHWSSDVFAGSSIGYFTGKAIVASRRNGEKRVVDFEPMLGVGITGMVLTVQF